MGVQMSQGHMISSQRHRNVSSTLSSPTFEPYTLNSPDSAIVTVIVVILFVIFVAAVWYSKMWRDKGDEHWFTSHSDSYSLAPGKDLFFPTKQIDIKELLLSKLRHIPKIAFRRTTPRPNRGRRKNGGYLEVIESASDENSAIVDVSSTSGEEDNNDDVLYSRNSDGILS